MVKIDFAFLPTTFIVYWILVHYRVGSLESEAWDLMVAGAVHYRVGSLENMQEEPAHLERRSLPCR